MTDGTKHQGNEKGDQFGPRAPLRPEKSVPKEVRSLFFIMQEQLIMNKRE